MEEKVAIVIPTYKRELSEFEKISLDRVKRIFSRNRKFFVLPHSLAYEYASAGIEEIRLDDSWFESIQSYNRLMLTIEFYEQFLDYEYILIYQLDAFVFSDNLEYFCDMGYDYIGAPWLDGVFHYRDPGHMVWYVGNGGLSLRKVDSFVRSLIEYQELLVNNPINEDLFFSSLDGDTFHVAPVDAALQFSFEMNVKECYEQNEERLPFGCHGWQKFDLPFWKPWIERYGYVIPEGVYQEEECHAEYSKRKGSTDFWTKKYDPEKLRIQILELLGNTHKNYAIWGAGYWGQVLCRMLEDAGIPVQIFIDKNRSLENTRIVGRDIVTPEKLKAMEFKYKVIVAAINGSNSIGDFLNEIKYRYRQDYIFFQDIDMIYRNVLT